MYCTGKYGTTYASQRCPSVLLHNIAYSYFFYHCLTYIILTNKADSLILSSCVDLLMFAQVAAVCKGFGADAAIERFLAAVDPLMSTQIPMIAE
jgi:hypothetical protein